jgi:hypothetical protein
VALLAGRPPDGSYVDACKRAFETLRKEGKVAMFSKQERNHLRGKFPAINFGVTHGKGTSEPVNLDNGIHDAMIHRIRSNEDFKRIATFASCEYHLDQHQFNLLSIWIFRYVCIVVPKTICILFSKTQQIVHRETSSRTDF